MQANLKNNLNKPRQYPYPINYECLGYFVRLSENNLKYFYTFEESMGYCDYYKVKPYIYKPLSHPDYSYIPYLGIISPREYIGIFKDSSGPMEKYLSDLFGINIENIDTILKLDDFRFSVVMSRVRKRYNNEKF